MTDYVSERPSVELDRKATKGIFAAFANHPTAPNLIMIVMILAGFWAAYNIPIQFFPETVINNVSVTMRWAGASPTDVDESLLEPVLPDLEALEGLNASHLLPQKASAILPSNSRKVQIPRRFKQKSRRPWTQSTCLMTRMIQSFGHEVSATVSPAFLCQRLWRKVI